MADFDWKQLEEAKKNLLKRAEELKKAFVEMPGGAPAGAPAGDPAAGGVPMDPAMAGGMPPGMDPAMMAAMGGMPPMGVDPATAGMLGGMPPDAGAGGALAGGAGAGTPEPTLTLTLSQLWDVVTKVLGLAKKIGANGQGITQDGTAAAPAQPAISQDAIKSAVIEALGAMR